MKKVFSGILQNVFWNKSKTYFPRSLFSCIHNIIYLLRVKLNHFIIGFQVEKKNVCIFERVLRFPCTIHKMIKNQKI